MAQVSSRNVLSHTRKPDAGETEAGGLYFRPAKAIMRPCLQNKIKVPLKVVEESYSVGILRITLHSVSFTRTKKPK